MRSPVAGRKTMEREALEEGLPVFRCVETGGIFIPSGTYWNWLHKQPDRLPRLPEPSSEPPIEEESSSIKICPETGTFMVRYKVGHGFDFHIDRSVSGSIWLDSGEWEALKERQYHDELHLVFAAPWQREILEQELEENEAQRLNERLGPELIEKLDALKNDLDGHPHRMQALAYLRQPGKREQVDGGI